MDVIQTPSDQQATYNSNSSVVNPPYNSDGIHRHSKKNRTLLSIPDHDGRFTWSPCAEKLPTAPGGSWRKDSPGWEKAEREFTATSGLRVRVRVRVCVCLCVCVCVCVCACKRAVSC